jgi:hypothetical protein
VGHRARWMRNLLGTQPALRQVLPKRGAVNQRDTPTGLDGEARHYGLRFPELQHRMTLS